MEKGLVISVAVLNLSAAFDTVDHDILLSVLREQLGITETALQWFDSYLKSCKFKV